MKTLSESQLAHYLVLRRHKYGNDPREYVDVSVDDLEAMIREILEYRKASSEK